MPIVSSEHDETRSRVCVLSVKQVRTIPRGSTFAAAERVLQYVRGTYDQGITYFDPGDETKNKLIGWVDSDFGSNSDTRKSMTGYLMSLNGGAISWRSSRQGGVTLSSSEAEFVAASQAGQEVVYLCALLRGCGYTQKKPLWGAFSSFL
jgi:hypothetical protein